ncbi:serine hydrolase FSH [Amylostereum chailletii]|nr:serine hydrolase FSH [Amylostereum chailletii]
MSESNSPPKVLVLHGYAQNANIFSKRLAALRKTLGKSVELVFLDAPILLYPVDLAETFGTSSASASDLSALGAAEASPEAEDPALMPRGWWKANKERTSSDGMEGTLDYLKGVLQGQRFEGVFGFSQGAAMAAMLAALLERPHIHPPFLVDGEAPHPPFKFCISASGFKPVGAFAEKLFTESFNTPTLHVIGKNDVLVVPERSQTLVEVSANARVEEHDGGHFVPSKANWRQFFKAYLLDPTGDVPSPSAAPSLPASGTATPNTTVGHPAL